MLYVAPAKFDDGSRETLVHCDVCNRTMRYDSQALVNALGPIPIMELEAYRINAALERAREDHECENAARELGEEPIE